MSEAEVERARLRVAQSKARLGEGCQLLKARLNPRTIAGNAVDAAKVKAIGAAEASVAAVKARPAVTIGIAAVLGLFLARKPISRAISSITKETAPAKIRSPRKATSGGAAGRKSVRKAKP